MRWAVDKVIGNVPSANWESYMEAEKRFLYL